ncbi:MAG: transposase [Nostoc sp.]|uniref:transposase n=1 Tax=Nostoc sp. TaxID=1180 RepID=UPI002FFC7450
MVTPRRQAVSTVAFIDNYCQHYCSVFEDVRHFEAFKFLHLGILSEIKRKTLPEIAKTVGLKDSQTLHHFLRDALWNVKKIREIRLWLIKMFIGEREIILCIDETTRSDRTNKLFYLRPTIFYRREVRGIRRKKV